MCIHPYPHRPLRPPVRYFFRKPRDKDRISNGRQQIYTQIPFLGFWPDLMLRRADNENIRQASRETLDMLEILMALNRTNLYTAFFNYHAHIGELEILIYEGHWGIRKRPVRHIKLDCRKYPLIDNDTLRPFYAQELLEWLILLVQ